MGDYNSNILNCNSDNETSDFIGTMYASSFYPTINTPTWITATSKTLLENIFYNTFTKNILVGNIATSISDHLTQFLITTNENKSLPEKEHNDIQTHRNYTKDKFLIDCNQIHWNNNLKINQNDPHQSSELFFQKLDQWFDKHCPKKTITKKQQTFLPKPWLTKGILKSIKVKNKTYQQFCKSSDPLKKNGLHIKFKTCRNSILKLTRQSKEDYFKSYFENNKKKKLKINMEQHQEPHKHNKFSKTTINCLKHK